ncbi:hypothetical protein DACRYDRAFT_108559 [Dacryopinax primogenitus]|uniref:Uncharacterized protein n=1 Tax=Dacryopinax primogenitus (strain DJM 731) TaxID=1858805 RepID=M5G3R2_DACPD|nr:uncharacterized protein DACRYDRAFT_108559 [Dacryopinax primogenitus]EJU00492.1 hypothetical protein DACRYDRAFT_108559 [Dacryopinax primogenitus]
MSIFQAGEQVARLALDQHARQAANPESRETINVTKLKNIDRQAVVHGVVLHAAKTGTQLNSSHWRLFLQLVAQDPSLGIQGSASVELNSKARQADGGTVLIITSRTYPFSDVKNTALCRKFYSFDGWLEIWAIWNDVVTYEQTMAETFPYNIPRGNLYGRRRNGLLTYVLSLSPYMIYADVLLLNQHYVKDTSNGTCTPPHTEMLIKNKMCNETNVEGEDAAAAAQAAADPLVVANGELGHFTVAAKPNGFVRILEGGWTLLHLRS